MRHSPPHPLWAGALFLLLLLAGPGDACVTTIPSCPDQYDCLALTFSRKPTAWPNWGSWGTMCPPSGGICQWTVCWKLDFDRPNCKKDWGETLQRMCPRRSNVCGGGDWGKSVDDTCSGQSFCQTGYGGSTITFTMVDEAKCTGSVAHNGSSAGLVPGASITCKPTTLATCPGCNFNECLWNITLPPCADSPSPIASPSPVPSRSPLPSPSPASRSPSPS
eukprot:EG_transcript_28206